MCKFFFTPDAMQSTVAPTACTNWRVNIITPLATHIRHTRCYASIVAPTAGMAYEYNHNRRMDAYVYICTYIYMYLCKALTRRLRALIGV